LVWTVTAVAADQGVQLAGVMVRHDGVDWSDAPLTRAPALQTLAPVWLISPQQGDTVGTTVDVHIAGLLADDVRLRVRDASGKQILDRAVPIVAGTPAAGTTGTASRGEAHVTVDLVPGTYTLEAYVSSGGTPAVVDDHVISVVAAPARSTG
jgi:hypothetical protein